MLWSSTSRFTLNFGGCSIWIIWRLHSAQRLQLHTKSLMVPQSRGSIYAKDRIVAGAISIIGSSFQGAVSCQKSTASFGKCFFFQASSREQLVANRPEGAKIFPQRKNWNFQGPSFSCNRKSHAWSSCQASQLRRSSPRVAQDLRQCGGCCARSYEAGSAAELKTILRIAQISVQNLVAAGQLRVVFHVAHVFQISSTSFPHQFHVRNLRDTWNPPFPIAISEEEKIQQGNPHDTQAGVQANEVLRAKKDRKHMITGQNPLHDSLVIVI